MLPTDYAFAQFLVSVGCRHLRSDAAVVAHAASAHASGRAYEAVTRSLAFRARIARGRRHAERRAIARAKAELMAPVATVAISATTRPKFTFTEAQMAIAIGVQQQQLTKAAS